MILYVYIKVYIYTLGQQFHSVKAMMRACLDGVARMSTSRDLSVDRRCFTAPPGNGRLKPENAAPSRRGAFFFENIMIFQVFIC